MLRSGRALQVRNCVAGTSNPKPVPAPAECDRFAPRSAMAAWRKYRSFNEGSANGSDRPLAVLQDRPGERKESARTRTSAEGVDCENTGHSART